MSEYTDEQVLSELMGGTAAQKDKAINAVSKAKAEESYNYEDIEIVSDEELANREQEKKNTIPYERFQQVNEQKNEYKEKASRAEELARENDELKRKMIEFQNSMLSKNQTVQPNNQDYLAKLNNENLTPEQLLATQDQRYMTKAEMQQFVQQFASIVQPTIMNDKLRNAGIDPKEFNQLAEKHPSLKQMNEDQAIALFNDFKSNSLNPRQEQARQASIGTSPSTTNIGGKRQMSESDFRKLFEQTYGKG